MIKFSTSRKFTALASGMFLASLLITSPALAADVPAGTQLSNNQVVHLTLKDDPPTLDPNQLREVVAYELNNQLYESLTSYDIHGKVVASTAESWTHSPDFKQWTFKIRPNAKWSDGSPVTAADFVASWRRLVDPKNGFAYSYYLRDLKVVNVDDIVRGKKDPTTLGVAALDDHTFQVNLEAPVPWFFKASADATLAPIPSKLLAAGKWPDPNHLVSNGPYKLASRIPNEKYVVVRNHQYWNDAHTVIEKGVYHVVKNETSGYQRALSGDLDIVPLTSPSLITSSKTLHNPELRVQTLPADQMIWFSFNVTRKPFEDVRVRKAIQLALDTQELQTKVLKDTVIATTRFTSSNIAGAKQIPLAPFFKQTREQRVAQANALLTAAGYNQAHPLKFDIAYVKNDQYKLAALAFQSQLKRAFGDKVVTGFKTAEWNVFLSSRQTGVYDFYLSGWIPDFYDLSNFYGIWVTGNAVNDGTKFSNATYDKLYNQLYTSPSEEARLKLYQQMDQILNEQVPAVIAYQVNSSYLLKKDIKDFSNTIRRLKFMYRVQQSN